MESTCALTVEPEVLGEGLCDTELEALLDEVADGPCVADEIPGREALVGCVEEGEVVALLHDGSDLAPLVLCGVDACGVMGAGVQEDDGALGGRGDGGDHAVEV